MSVPGWLQTWCEAMKMVVYMDKGLRWGSKGRTLEAVTVMTGEVPGMT